MNVTKDKLTTLINDLSDTVVIESDPAFRTRIGAAVAEYQAQGGVSANALIKMREKRRGSSSHGK